MCVVLTGTVAIATQEIACQAVGARAMALGPNAAAKLARQGFLEGGIFYGTFVAFALHVVAGDVYRTEWFQIIPSRASRRAWRGSLP